MRTYIIGNDGIVAGFSARRPADGDISAGEGKKHDGSFFCLGRHGSR
jgi:hypothetical protein